MLSAWKPCWNVLSSRVIRYSSTSGIPIKISNIIYFLRPPLVVGSVWALSKFTSATTKSSSHGDFSSRLLIAKNGKACIISGWERIINATIKSHKITGLHLFHHQIHLQRKKRITGQRKINLHLEAITANSSTSTLSQTQTPWPWMEFEICFAHPPTWIDLHAYWTCYRKCFQTTASDGLMHCVIITDNHNYFDQICLMICYNHCIIQWLNDNWYKSLFQRG